jgi:hypothetical protein
MLIRRGASAEIRTTLKQSNLESSVGQRARRREPCKTSAYNAD